MDVLSPYSFICNCTTDLKLSRHICLPWFVIRIHVFFPQIIFNRYISRSSSGQTLMRTLQKRILFWLSTLSLTTVKCVLLFLTMFYNDSLNPISGLMAFEGILDGNTLILPQTEAKCPSGTLSLQNTLVDSFFIVAKGTSNRHAGFG